MNRRDFLKMAASAAARLVVPRGKLISIDQSEVLGPIVPEWPEWPTGDTGASFSGSSSASLSSDEPAVFVSPDDEVVMVGDKSDLEDIPGITPSVDCFSYGQRLYPSSDDVEVYWSVHDYADAEKATDG